MDGFIKAAAVVLIAVIMCLVIAKRDKDLALMLAAVACCMVISGALQYLQPVIEFIEKLQSLSGIDLDFFLILLKSVGISLLAEIASLICTDVGNAALGKSLQIMSTAVILWLSLPLFNALLDLIQKILDAI